jgi:hypothetical protein
MYRLGLESIIKLNLTKSVIFFRTKALIKIAEEKKKRENEMEQRRKEWLNELQRPHHFQ